MSASSRKCEDYIGFVRQEAYRLKRRLPPQVHADDLFAAGLVGAWRALERYDGRMSFWAYFQKRIHYAMIDELRRTQWAPRRTPQPEFDRTYPLHDALDPKPVNGQRIEAEDELHSRKRKLDAREKAVLLLHFREGMTLKQIAAVFGISESRMCQLVKEAQQKARE
jgi:RNA polymerase sigma factor for flagellar operon FliA